MLQMPKGQPLRQSSNPRSNHRFNISCTAILTMYNLFSPLKPAELQVLRAQYEKEGDYVGVQTKFNYAWV